MNPLLDELRQLEAELHHPGVDCTRERLERLLHPGFHEVGRSGVPYTRGTVLDHLAGHPGPTAVEADEYALELLAEGCALLTYRSLHRRADGTALDAARRCSIWLRTAQGWQLAYHQGTPCPLPPGRDE